MGISLLAIDMGEFYNILCILGNFQYDTVYRSRGEMDIIPVFGTVVGGSNPSESTSFLAKSIEVSYTEFVRFCEERMRVWFSGRMRPCQGRDGSSILPTRTKTILRVLTRLCINVDNFVDSGYKGQIIRLKIVKTVL